MKPPENNKVDDKILDAALALAARKPWENVTMAELAQDAGLTLAELRAQIAAPFDVLEGLHDRLDRAMLAATAFEGEIKDRLFDALMARFDAMQSSRDGYLSLFKSVKSEPSVLARGACMLMGTSRWALEAAGTANKGKLPQTALSFVYLNALRIWMGDDSRDLSATMAAVDKGLDRALGFIR